MNAPLRSVSAVCRHAEVCDVSVTCAEETGFCCASVTLPRTVPKIVAQAGQAANKTMIHARATSLMKRSRFSRLMWDGLQPIGLKPDLHEEKIRHAAGAGRAGRGGGGGKPRRGPQTSPRDSARRAARNRPSSPAATN